MINYMNSLIILTGIIMILPFNISHAQIEPDPSQPIGPTNKVFTPWEYIERDLNIK